MRKFIVLIIISSILSGEVYSQTRGGMVRTSIVLQKWSVENVSDPISEASFPIEVTFPIRENIHIQFNHSPAVSRFGNDNLSGLSDTWIRSTYSLADNRTLFSVGLGLPTGKTGLNSGEVNLTNWLSQNIFKFRLPVFGQGFTLSAGAMYAYPINPNITLGAGVNYIIRGKYKFSQGQSSAYDPGDQLGLDLGVDYLITPRLQSNADLVFSYYTADKLGNTWKFKSGLKFSGKLGILYQVNFGNLWLRANYRSKAKNETWDGQSLVTDDKNYNITQRELEVGAKINLTDIFALFIIGEARSYVENELEKGWADIAGFGSGYELSLSETFQLSMIFKFFFGDGEFMNQNPTLSGTEFNIGTQWKF